MYVATALMWIFINQDVRKWIACGAPHHHVVMEPHVRTSDNGLALIKTQEDCRLTAYPDPRSPRGVEMAKPLSRRVAGWARLDGKPWSIGWGHTGSEVHEGLVWPQQQCDLQLVQDVWAREIQLNRMVKVPLTQNQFDALMSLLYNIGEGNLAGSTLIRELNRGHYKTAAAQFAVWRKSRGVVDTVLARRRAVEARLFTTP